jgi:hypothetical protein
MTFELSSKWQTVATVGYHNPVSRDENRAAHGGVCLLQARKGARGTIGRKVNSNGRHEEIGTAFELASERLQHWQRIASAQQ